MPRRLDSPATAELEIRVASDRVRMPLAESRVRQLVRTVLRAEGRAVRPASRRADMTITFVGPTRMRQLNRAWKRRDMVTDVLSFALRHPGGGVTGDVYICPAAARANAREHRVTLSEELARLVVHGTLHALGYDHPEGSGRTRSAMWRRQEGYVKALT